VTWRLAAVLAHPDDDTYALGGIVAMEGKRLAYTAIVATSGEAGIIADPSLATRENLAHVREGEELRSLEVLGATDPSVHFLRYPDGELDGVPRVELVGRVATILRESRPHVVATFGPEGVTKHADHIAIGQATSEAFHLLQAESTDGRAFQRLLYSSLPQSRLDRWWDLMRGRGVEIDPDGPFMPRGVPDHSIAIEVDCGVVFERKLAALAAHATQADEISMVPKELRREAFGFESFVQAWPPQTDPDPPRLASVFQDLTE
jgi:LmbE family N-acetylglucosaminyl deacetylase